MEPTAIVLGVVAAVLAGVVGWLVVGRGRLVAEAARARGEFEGFERELAGMRDQLGVLREQASLGTERVVELSRTNARYVERLENAEKVSQELERGRAQLAETFKALAADTLRESQVGFLRLAQTKLGEVQAKGAGELDKKRQAFEELVKPIRETLGKTQEQLIRLGGSIDASLAGTASLKDQTMKLARALSRPEVRGRYGEIQLRRVVELAGMVNYCDFTEQMSVRDDEGRLLRPDMVVRLPNERMIVVDAKTNMQAYLDAIGAETPEEQEAHLERFARHVAEQIKALSSKRYWASFEQSPDFVVMFVPGDHFIDAALQRRPDLLDVAAQQDVILASPSTLIGLLRAVAVGWREQTLAQEARELLVLGKELHERAVVAFGHAAGLGSAIRRTVEKFNTMVGSIESRMMPTLRKFEEVGISGGKALEGIPEVTVVPRSLEGVVEPVVEGETGEGEH